MNQALSLALTPLATLYGAVISTRAEFYRRGILRAQRVGVPVISVGNLTTGGTGKTPLVQCIAKELCELGRRCCVLTRGYGRQSSGRVVVSNGREILADALQGGDEPLLLAENLKGRAAVISDADRVSAARWAVDNLQSDVFLLDDGFQHQKLARDLNLLAIDATNPWGTGKLLPAGNLREPAGAIARADCVVLTRADESVRTSNSRREIEQVGFSGPIFEAHTKIAGWRRIGKQSNSIEEDHLRLTLAAFCGLANPESFFSLIGREGGNLRHTQAFPDHHIYKQDDIRRMTEESRAAGAQALVTSAKDEVKLRSLEFTMPLFVLDIEPIISQAEQLKVLIRKAITAAE
jgi:tetraacyldisaccharide 4'-kinase